MTRPRPRAVARYRALLALYPRGFRRQFGDDVAQLFGDRLRAARGPGARLAVWLCALADLVLEAGAERIDHLRRRLRGRRRPPRPLAAGRVVLPSNTLHDRMGRMLHDLRYTVRALGKRPGFTVVVVLVMALGIGLNTALFSVVKATILTPLPFPEAERLTVLWGTYEGASYWSLGVPELRDLEARSALFDEIGVFADYTQLTRTGGDAAESLAAGYATASFFSLLGVAPLHGRTFEPAEDQGLDAHPVAVLSYPYWQRAYGGDPAALGGTIELRGLPHTVVGILPEHFRFSPMDVWLPLSMGTPTFGRRFYERRTSRFHRGIARLPEGVDAAAAQRELGALMAELEVEHPEAQRARGVQVFALRDYFFGRLERPVRTLFAGAALVLLICCVNVGALFLARGVARRREMAVRAALGASRARLLATFLVESALLVLAGGALGIALASWATGAVVAAFDLGLPSFATIAVDRQVLAVSLALVAATGLGLGLVPALRAGGRGALGAGGRQLGGGRGAARRRGALIAIEVAVALVLLVGAGLTLRSLTRLTATPLGFDSRDLLTMQVDLRADRFDLPDRDAAYAARNAVAVPLVERVAALPGVRAAAIWGPAMPTWANMHTWITPQGYDLVPDRENRFFSQYLTMGPGALATLGIPLLQGRDFTAADRGDGARAVIIDQRLARRFYGADAVGRTLHTWADDQPQAWTVVGVAADVRHRGRRNDEDADGVAGDVYFPYAQSASGRVALVLRLEPGVAAGGTAEAVRRTLAAIDPDVPVANVATMDQRLQLATAVPRFAATLMAVYALVAAILAFVGTYGLLAYAVRARRTEIALRAALGARHGRLLGMVFRQGMTPVLVGVAGGLGAALLMSRLIEGLLFGIARTDPATYAAAAALVLAAAAAACLVPARRAARCDPATTLRYE